MKIRVESNENINNNEQVKINNSFNNTFKEILNTKKNEVQEREKAILKKQIDNSNGVKLFNKILEINESTGRNMYLKDNGKVDVMKMLNEYGDDLNTNELNKLVSVLGGLHKEGLIDDKDYFDALKWIRTKIEEKSIQIEIEKKEFAVIDSLDEE